METEDLAHYHKWRWMAVMAVAVLLTGSLVYTGLRLRVTYINSLELGRIRDEVVDLNTRLALHDKSDDERLSYLESTIFADLQPKMVEQLERDAAKPRVRVPEPWSANRDRDLREQIRQVRAELFRLQERVRAIENERIKP